MPGRFGLSVALATPFQLSGAVDNDRLKEQAGWCLAMGCSSITLFGTTGEGASIGLTEREAIFSALARDGITGERIVGGVAATAVSDAAAQATLALDHGCRALLVPPPYFFKGVAEDGVFGWYAALVERLGHRARHILLYNIPQMTAVAMPLSLITRLIRAFPEVFIGVKDSAGDWPYTEQLLEAHRDRVILVGDERSLARAVRNGGQGAISGLANICPDALLPLVMEGRPDQRIDQLVETVLGYPVMAAVKALVAHRSGDTGWLTMRPPLTALSRAEMAQLGERCDRIFSATAA
ncbi:dihydrodipicolinate synthase family protein [Chelatococcus asaccharovorans]|uniref:4-hydroxy-tetrahydrodipicolinate synthase n=1 Tax=Chelatococcus asaccharovorans TaxID=28210 RepID=A0A2V3U1W3_9HYPH|nr:dihydrodipicolinate synthase family protein [Chelatococcus asaccharovorans]MBS7702403.1 dihydrodipicolinate synthase family protein [Chelatococcus asaccharovorans]PXW56395.1 4-hydroxy-tetrahydrodipicolinate synthase [Chelatococcus asaccharovorans]